MGTVLKGQLECGTPWVKDTTPTQWAYITLCFQNGCDPAKDEYEILISSLVGNWTFEDIDKLNESIVDWFDVSTAPKEGEIVVMFEEDGEWDGFPCWHKYYTAKHVNIISY